jgi:predicted nucleotidyltransferase
MINRDSIKVNIETNIEDELNKARQAREEIKQLKNEIKEIAKIDYNVNILNLKRKDILVVRLNGIMTSDLKDNLEKQLKKLLKRKVLVVDERVGTLEVIHR